MSESLADIGGRALVVDHDRAGVAGRCDELTSTGWRLMRAATADEATATVRDYDVDVVILHVGSFDTKAAALPHMLHLAAEAPHLPVIVLAHEPSEETRCQFLNSGANDIAGDDISLAELDARLHALMRSKVLQDELRRSKEALLASLEREQTLLQQLRRDNAHLMTLSATDPLTHLQNIRHFDSFLENEFKIARRYNRRLSLLAFDLDHFKVVNDTYGHPSGDYVLKEFAVILKQSVRDSDVIARTGGEEFSIILPDAGRSRARRFAHRILRAASDRKFIVLGKTIHVTTSIGAASYPEDAEITDPQMLVFLADQALLQAKQLGRDRFIAFGELDAPIRQQLRREFRASQPSRGTASIDPVLAADVRR